MRSSSRSVPKIRFIAITFVLGFCGAVRPAYSQQMPPADGAATEAKKLEEPEKKGGMEDEVAHGFFTHEGLPDAVGTFSLRSAGLVTRADGATKGDFAFHLETGLTKNIGLHIRNDRFLNNTHTEAMFQFAALTSKNGKSGFAPIIEFEFPTRSGASGINTLVGFTTKIANPRAAFNSVIHYNPKEGMTDSSASFVVKVASRYYPVMEVLAEAGSGQRPIVNLLMGLKVRVSESTLLGFAFVLPATDNKEFSSQLVFQPDVEWERAR